MARLFSVIGDIYLSIRKWLLCGFCEPSLMSYISCANLIQKERLERHFIRTVRVTHPTDDKPVVLVDTPGFGDTSKSDTEILGMIADWIVKCESITTDDLCCC
jgi:hypothetical protein